MHNSTMHSFFFTTQHHAQFHNVQLLPTIEHHIQLHNALRLFHYTTLLFLLPHWAFVDLIVFKDPLRMQHLLVAPSASTPISQLHHFEAHLHWVVMYVADISPNALLQSFCMMQSWRILVPALYCQSVHIPVTSSHGPANQGETFSVLTLTQA